MSPSTYGRVSLSLMYVSTRISNLFGIPATKNVVVRMVLLLFCLRSLWVVRYYHPNLNDFRTGLGFVPDAIEHFATSTSTSTSTSPPSPPSPPPPPLLVEKRTMFAAGYDARSDVGPADGNTYWTWGPQTEERFQHLFDGVNKKSESTCSSDTPVYIMERGEWGLGSRLRDTMDMLLTALNHSLPVVHSGPDHCVMSDDTDNDDYMICLFQKFSYCQGTVPVPSMASCWKNECNVTIHRGELHYPPHWKEMLSDWWKSIKDNDTGSGSSNGTNTGTDLRRFDANGPVSALEREPSEDEMLEVFRSLLLRSAFVPTQEIERRIRRMEEGFSSLGDHQPMIAVHVRRGDKIWMDNPANSSIAHEDMRTHTPIQTLKHVHALLRAAERLSGTRFRSIFLMSDEPSVYGEDAKAFLASALWESQNQAVPVYGDDEIVRKHFGAKLPTHEALDARLHQELDMQLLATMYFLARHASYLVGYGKSGVSQTIAQLLGSTHRMSPSALSLFEDDTVLLGHLDETKDFPIALLK